MSQELREDFLKLPVAARLERVQGMRDSIAADCERKPFPLTEAQREKLEQQIHEFDAPTGASDPLAGRSRAFAGAPSARVSSLLALSPANLEGLRDAADGYDGQRPALSDVFLRAARHESFGET